MSNNNEKEDQSRGPAQEEGKRIVKQMNTTRKRTTIHIKGYVIRAFHIYDERNVFYEYANPHNVYCDDSIACRYWGYTSTDEILAAGGDRGRPRGFDSLNTILEKPVLPFKDERDAVNAWMEENFPGVPHIIGYANIQPGIIDSARKFLIRPRHEWALYGKWYDLGWSDLIMFPELLSIKDGEDLAPSWVRNYWKNPRMSMKALIFEHPEFLRVQLRPQLLSRAKQTPTWYRINLNDTKEPADGESNLTENEYTCCECGWETKLVKPLSLRAGWPTTQKPYQGYCESCTPQISKYDGLEELFA